MSIENNDGQVIWTLPSKYGDTAEDTAMITGPYCDQEVINAANRLVQYGADRTQIAKDLDTIAKLLPEEKARIVRNHKRFL